MSTRFVRFVAAWIIAVGFAGSNGSALANLGMDIQDLAASASPAGTQFVHIATEDNSFLHYTRIDHPLANGHPEAVIFATPNWNPGGPSPGVYNNHPIGLWYSEGTWRIFNQDLALMPEGAAFNLFIPTPGANVFIHTAATVDGNHTLIDNAQTNGNPNAILFVTPNYNPGGACPCAYANYPIGVAYDGGAGKWSIFNQNGSSSSMTVNTSFNVLVLSAGAGIFVHSATAGNISDNTTDIDHSLTNNHPNALVFITPNWNPGGAGGIYNNHDTGVWYTGSKMSIFNQDIYNMPLNAAFNVLVLIPASDAFLHRARGGNIITNTTAIDHYLLNSQPNAIAFVIRNWGFDSGGIIFPPFPPHHNIGLYYSGDRWRIINQDGVDMLGYMDFNVLVPASGANVFVHKASATNTIGSGTAIDHPLTNNRLEAIILITQSYNPGGGSGVYNDHPIGVFYDDTIDKWAIYNRDWANMPIGASFNVFIPPPGANAFQHQATISNISYEKTKIDNSRINDRPNALLFTTYVFSGGGLGFYNSSSIGVVYTIPDKWAIKNEDFQGMLDDWLFNVYVGNEKIYLPLVIR